MAWSGLGIPSAAGGLPLALLLAGAPAAAEPALTARTVAEAAFGEPGPARGLMAKTQILLDRAGFSVGVIDGLDGENTRKALEALELREGLLVDGRLDEDLWAALAPQAIEPVLIDYRITEADLAGPFLEELPQDYRALAKLERIPYTGPLELIAERFHMDEDLLRELNPGKDFGAAGTPVTVAAVGKPVTEPRVERIEVDGGAGLLRAYGRDGGLIVFYPATVGSRDMPGPKGRHQVRAVAMNPEYTYDPETNFTQGNVRERLNIPPGPNGPVGSVWIDLTEPTYGIHGTARPAEVDKTWSHGCVRLTNWDAEELANLVREGSEVEFLRSDDPRAGRKPTRQLSPADVESAAKEGQKP